MDVTTIGDGMITMNPKTKGPLRFSNEFERKIGGAELNVAIGCARLGLKSSWISRLGDDEFGRYILNYTRGEGIDVSSVKLESEYNTPLNFKEISESGSGRTFYYRFPSPTESIKIDDVENSSIKDSKILYISGVFASFSSQNRELIKKAITIAKENKVRIALDPNIRLKLWSKAEARAFLLEILPDVDIMLSGKEEADIIFGSQNTEEHIESLKKYDIQYIAIKKGEDGAVCCLQNMPNQYTPSFPVKNAVDTVGAGDGFNVGFLYGILNKWSLDKIAVFANKIGAMVVEVSGDNEGLPYLKEVQQALGEHEKIER